MKATLNRAGKSVLRYGTGKTPVGDALLVLSEKGICVLHILKSERIDAALEEVRRKHPEADLIEDRKAVLPVLRQVNEVLAGERDEVEMPLDLRGTSFQQRVWRAMCKVGRGETCSYSELARRAGVPRAVRAVASVCARNPVALLVPCHRIVAKNGLGGYGGGLDRKCELLRQENAL